MLLYAKIGYAWYWRAGSIQPLLIPEHVASMRLSRKHISGFHTNGHEVDLLAVNSSGINGRVLRLEVGRELGAVVTTVRLSPEAKVTALVVGERLVEVLEELPDVFRSTDSGGHGISAVAETGTNGLCRQCQNI